jgi:hypothetical protein
LFAKKEQKVFISPNKNRRHKGGGYKDNDRVKEKKMG